MSNSSFYGKPPINTFSYSRTKKDERKHGAGCCRKAKKGKYEQPRGWHTALTSRDRGTRPIFRHGCLKLVGVTSLNARDTRRKIKLHAEGTHYAASNVTWYHASGGASSNDARTGWWHSNILFRSFPFCHEVTFLFVFSRVPPSFSLYLSFYLPPFLCWFTLFLPVCLSALTCAWKIPIISKLVYACTLATGNSLDGHCALPSLQLVLFFQLTRARLFTANQRGRVSIADCHVQSTFFD